jgi:O-antigen/teichoic acid export membrane protein
MEVLAPASGSDGVDTAGASAAAARPPQPRAIRMARNIIVVTGGQFLTWSASSVLIIITPRYLGDTNVGRYAFAFSITGIATAIILFGSVTYLAREIARRPDDARALAWNGLLSRLPAIALLTLAVIAFVHLGGYPETTRTVVYIACAAMALQSFGSVITAALQGLERMSMMSAVTVVDRFLLLGTVLFLVVYLDQGVIAYALATLAALAAATLMRFAFFIRVVGLRAPLDLELCRRLYRESFPFLVWSVALLIYGSVDIVMLSLMEEEAVVGWYGLAYRFVAIPAFIPSAVATALLPSLSAATGEEFTRLARRCVDLLTVITVPITLFFVFGSASLIDFMRYGSGFDNSVILMQILGLIGVPVALGIVAGTALMATDHESAWAKVAVAAAVLNPLMNLVAIPYFAANYDNGAIGAAITTVITEGGMLTAALILAPRGIFGRDTIATFVRALLAGVPMVGATLLAAPYGFIPLLAAGSLAYAIGAVLFGAVRPRDIIELPRTVLARRPAEAAL